MTIVVEGDGPVLAVDDDAIFRDIFELLYEFSGIENELILFDNGQACLDYCEKLKETDLYPSVILMDINMPGINGLETVRKLRSIERFVSIPIIVMLTSSSEKHDIEESQKVGANDYMVKPQSVEDLQFVKG